MGRKWAKLLPRKRQNKFFLSNPLLSADVFELFIQIRAFCPFHHRSAALPFPRIGPISAGAPDAGTRHPRRLCRSKLLTTILSSPFRRGKSPAPRFSGSGLGLSESECVAMRARIGVVFWRNGTRKKRRRAAGAEIDRNLCICT